MVSDSYQHFCKEEAANDSTCGIAILVGWGVRCIRYEIKFVLNFFLVEALESVNRLLIATLINPFFFSFSENIYIYSFIFNFSIYRWSTCLLYTIKTPKPKYLGAHEDLGSRVVLFHGDLIKSAWKPSCFAKFPGFLNSLSMNFVQKFHKKKLLHHHCWIINPHRMVQTPKLTFSDVSLLLCWIASSCSYTVSQWAASSLFHTSS